MLMRRTVILMLAVALVLGLAGCKGEPESSRPDMKALRAAEVGSYVYFGEYEQDDDTSTGKEAIEWLVLAKEEDRMLLISRYGLDAQQYHTERDFITWEDCSLRNWLNTTFLEAAFIPEEKDLIEDHDVSVLDLDSEIDNPKEKMIKDKVFLLSLSDAEEFFADDDARSCVITPYCYTQGAKKTRYDTCSWWLRSVGRSYARAACVSPNGEISVDGVYVEYNIYAIRPAVWINIGEGK